MRSYVICTLALGTFAWGYAGAQPASFSQPHGDPSNSAAAYAAKLKADWARRAALGQVPATVTEPSVTSGKILTRYIDVNKAPGTAALELTLAAGTVGVAGFQVTISSPSQSRTVVGGTYIPSYPSEAATETVKFQVPAANAAFGNFGLYAEPGDWTIVGVEITSEDGTFVAYFGSQLTALFPSIVLHVASRTPDVTPPTFSPGKILTPTVSAGGSSPYFAAKLPVADDVSGVANVSIGILAPGQSFPTLSAYTTASLPIHKGVIAPYATLPANSPAGTYTLESFTVCDVAGNCSGGNDATAVKAEFGTTTFQVTP